MQHLKGGAKWAITLGLLAVTALSWTHHLDDAAQAANLTHFKRALAVAALARGFNGVISVAQGTEVAIQPVGVGVTLTIGEILDPLNDLVERFSGLALIASVSLGLQMTLSEIMASTWVSALLSAAVAAYLMLLWLAPNLLSKRGAVITTRALAAVIFLRFLLAVMLLMTYVVDHTFLAAKQEQAVAQITHASATIEQLQEQNSQTSVGAEENDLFGRTAAQISDLLDTSRQTLDLKAQLAEVEAQVENSVEELINLIVIFLLQTLLLPIASLWLCWWALKAFWRRAT